MHAAAILALAVSAGVGRCEATTFVMMNDYDLAARSIAAVTGQVTRVEAASDTATGGVNTYIRIEPHALLFGRLPAGALVLREAGGDTAVSTERIFGSAAYRVGEEVLVFVSQNGDGTLRTTAMAMGKFELKGRAGRSYTATRDLGEGVKVWDLSRRRLGVPGPEEYDADALVGSLKRARSLGVRALGARGAVQMVPPELARTTTTVRAESFTYLSPQSRWIEPDSGQAISYLIDAAGDVGVGAAATRAAVDDALAAWTTVPSSDLTLLDGGDLPQPITFAGCIGGNRIAFNDPFNEITDPIGCSGVLAIGGFCNSTETSTVDGNSFRRIRVGKIMFNNGWSTCPGWNRCAVAEVATHELGHTVGFGHSADVNATMYATAHFDGRCAALRADDLSGLNTLYPILSPPTLTPSPTPIPAAPTATATPPPPTPTRTPISVSTATATATPVPSDTPATPGTGTVTVGGQVRYYSTDQSVPGTRMNLDSSNQHRTTETSAAGDFEFNDLPTATWQLTARKDGDFGAGVTALDAAHVLQAVSNLRQLDPLQRLACDVTGDGQLSALDAVRILELSVGMIRQLPVALTCGSDWAFVPDPSLMPQQSVTPPSVSHGTCVAGTILLSGLSTAALDQRFRAILFGDCTGNWSQAPRAAAERRAPRVRIGRPDVDRHGVVRVEVFLRSRAAYSSLELQLAYDADRVALRDVIVRPPAGPGATASQHVLRPGVLRVGLAAAHPIARVHARILTVEFTLANAADAPGAIVGTTASVDELAATLTGRVGH
jgi:hypothetical protein